MKYLLIIILTITLSCNLEKNPIISNSDSSFVETKNSNTNEYHDTTEFFRFVSLFSDNLSVNEISEHFRNEFLNLNWSEEELQNAYVNCIADSILFQTENYIGLIYTINCMAGGICETNHLAIFNKNGELLETLKVGYSFGDLLFEDIMTFEFFNGNKLKLIKSSIEKDENEEIISKKTDTTIVEIKTILEN